MTASSTIELPCPSGAAPSDSESAASVGKVGAASVLAVTCAHNEIPKLNRVIDRLTSLEWVTPLIIDDASTDYTPGLLNERGVRHIRNPHRRGVGASIRLAIDYLLEHDYEILVLLAGNDKDRPDEISRLLAPILADELDFVQGSRYLPGGQAGNMPRHRAFATKYMHPWLFSAVSGQHMTDTTNGFRAIHRRVLERLRPLLEPRWLDAYELEVYLLYKAIESGFRVGEVPVSKIYPPHEQGYTKMKPLTGWWSILRPLVLLGLGIRK